MDRRTNRTLLVGVIAAVATSVLLAPVATADVVTPRTEPAPITQLQALTVTPSSVTVTGLGTVTVTVAATIRADGGIVTWASEPQVPWHNRVLATFRHVGPTPSGVPSTWTTVLALTSGTEQQGTWTGSWRVGAAWGGRWILEQLDAETPPMVTNSGRPWRVSPAAVGMPRSVVVAGLNPPRMAVTRTPAVATYPADQTVTFRFTNARGTPLSGRSVMVDRGEGCGHYGVGGWTSPPTRVLSAAGTTSTTLRLRDPASSWSYGISPSFLASAPAPRMSDSTGDLCVYLTDPTGAVDVFGLSVAPPAGGALLGERATHRWRFSAVTTSHRRLPCGRLLVTGVVAPALYWVAPTVYLQRLFGRTWRTVTAARVPGSGRYRTTVTAAPGWYRVLARGLSPEFAPTPGSSFRVGG